VFIRLIGRRLVAAIPLLFLVTLLSFGLMNLLPGDAAVALLGLHATHAQVMALTLRLHLNLPFWDRYWNWLHAAAVGNFGTSLASGQPVASIIRQRLPVTAEVAVLALLWAVLLAVPAAVVEAKRPGGVVDKLGLTVSMVGLSTPSLVLAIVLVVAFAVDVHAFPVAGYQPISASLPQNLHDMALPAIVIGFSMFAYYSRVLRTDIVDHMVGEDYVLTARAKGLSPRRVLYRHALPNASFGVLTLIGIDLGTLLSSTVIVESIFGLPGIGQELVQAIGDRDTPVVQGILIVLALAVLAANLVTDLAYVVLDPRLRHGAAHA
jgi:peptide/nickel transport system permease protein